MEQLEVRTLMAASSVLTYPMVDTAQLVSSNSSVSTMTGGVGATHAVGQNAGASSTAAPAMNLAQTLSDQAQRTTLAFDALAMMTGNLDAQSFFPPGKVADYTGFQYLRDNDPDRMGHNTSFLTRVANNVIYTLSDSQLAQLQTLATAQLSQFNLYAYKRFPLMQAFRRLMDGDLPAGSSGLSLDAVKTASRELYLLDGQISFDRALLYANIIKSLSTTQKAYLDAMKGKGFNSWPNITDDQIKTKMQSLPQGTGQLVMTYASDLFSWYAGSVDADVYFCPERQGTYYGGFYMKDAPAVGHEGYSISEELTATAGAALCDSSKGYVTQAQAATLSSLVDMQRNNLYAGTTNIVQTRTQIATLLRSLLTSTASSDSVKAQVLSLSGTYGDLDGENNYNYATVFSQVYGTLTADQKTKLATLRKSILSGTYADGTPFDYTVATTPFVYSSAITDESVLAPYIANTDYLFNSTTKTFSLTSDVGVNGGTLPIDYTADGSGASPALSWSNVPAGTKEFALMMTTLPGDGTTKWNWVLYNIPATSTSLLKNTIVGTGGQSSDVVMGYAPPCSQGPGAKLYTFTLYALSASPTLPSADQVTGDVLTKAISGITLGSTSLNLSYTRTAPVAAFTFATKPGGVVDFTNGSGKSTASWQWDFGDKATSQTPSPSHTYASAGTYNVKLTVTNAFGSNTTSQNITVSDAKSPEIQVLSGTTDIRDGTGIAAFGSTTVGTAISKTFTIKNIGTGTLTLSTPITVPAGFTVTSSFGSTTLAAGASTTFVVRMNATAAGNYSGKLLFANNDSDESTFDFTISGTVTAKTGTVRGTVWNDVNNNGRRDTSEKGLSGWQVYADLNKNGKFDAGEPVVNTASDGTYQLSLAAGTYTLREAVLQGWQPTAPATGSFSITVTAGGTVIGRDFGNRTIPTPPPVKRSSPISAIDRAALARAAAAPVRPTTQATASGTGMAQSMNLASGDKRQANGLAAIDAVFVQGVI